MKKMIEMRRGRGGGGSRAASVPNLSLLNGVVAAGVLTAMRTADRIFTKAGIPHVLVGGLAVGAYGHPRATKDADFLVNDAAFTRRHGIVRMRPEIPIDVRGVGIDTLWANAPEEHAAIGSSPTTGGVRVAPIEVIVAMKIRARRIQDDADVVAMLRYGADEDAIRAALTKFDPGLVGRFEQLAEHARYEGRSRR